MFVTFGGVDVDGIAGIGRKGETGVAEIDKAGVNGVIRIRCVEMHEEGCACRDRSIANRKGGKDVLIVLSVSVVICVLPFTVVVY